ncbi:MAG: threonine--tRNA ligase [Candidatus Andersenbacteria bacterium]
MAQEPTSTENLPNLRHSTAHLLAAAVLQLWPDAKPTLGPPTEDGFYYDFEFQEPISENDLKKIEKVMKRLLPSWKEFVHEEVSATAAKELFANNPYKQELIDEIAERGEVITLYTAGKFTDLCRGGHVEQPNKELQHFTLLTLAGAYWRGDEKNTMLTRIYGTAFPTKEELDEYLANLAEAKKRDHRKLGQQLDLFTFSPLVGPGLPLFTPRGTIVRRELEKFIWSLQGPMGYQEVTIPHLAKPELYKVSGHWDKFKDDLFHVRGHHDEFVIKPMNCPHHTQIYASRQRSYRELPLRFAEVTTVYRDEQAGQLQGLTRVRSITQDDAHVFCRPDQIEGEILRVLTIVEQFYKTFDLSLSFRLSLRDPQHPEKYLGSDDIWENAQNILRNALNVGKGKYIEVEGEAAFYGPKIDFMARDSLGRTWQMATVQLDFNMPARFDLTYVDDKGDSQTPVMIHRAISGAIERFMAILIEHYAGNLPLWLSPTQVVVLPISEDQNKYAQGVATQLQTENIRVEVREDRESVGKKIREAEVMKVPVMLIVGKQEVEAQSVAVRTRAEGDLGMMPTAEITAELREKIKNRA